MGRPHISKGSRGEWICVGGGVTGHSSTVFGAWDAWSRHDVEVAVMGKPNWSEAPHWAGSLVQRDDGRWVFFEGTAFIFDGLLGGEWVSETNRYEPMGFTEPPAGDGWRETLEVRP